MAKGLPSNMPFFDFKIEGAKELDKVLKELPEAAAKSQLKAALKKSAKSIVADARSRAWRSKGGAEKGEGKTGSMADSIKPFVMTNTAVPAAIAIGPDAAHWYGVFQEYGTPWRPAEPFMRPAWDTNKRAALAAFAKNMWYVLERFAKRLKKQAYAGKLSRSGRKALGL